ncbi:hypothetical protein CUU95_18150 [Vreelandella alkaliphila]|uniref:hypothetical protein n=1 Tax=Vreelandella alkaliphila TaxID=272774 RepID=UPI000EA1BBB1|nr:hypothetical protein [Halomonas alkaliphila]AYF35617.1 hypothetical protein CUU95_18150 [Halomonas alkaliphila]
MHVRIDGEYRYTEECVRVDGRWRAASRWEKINGQWVLVRDASTWALHELNWEDDNFWGGLETP